MDARMRYFAPMARGCCEALSLPRDVTSSGLLLVSERHWTCGLLTRTLASNCPLWHFYQTPRYQDESTARALGLRSYSSSSCNRCCTRPPL